jgi:molybdopterin molybdotransferase
MNITVPMTSIARQRPGACQLSLCKRISRVDGAGIALERHVSDVRLLGFATRAPFATVLAWIEQHTNPLRPETIPVSCAVNRILAAPVRSQVDQPDTDRAARDGYAVLASDTEAADSYTPLPLRLTDSEAWQPGDAAAIASGAPMPAGANAVLPFELAVRQDGALSVMAATAPGAGVRRRGSDTQAGQDILPKGRRLRPADPGSLTALGVTAIDVVQRPTVALLVAGSKTGETDLLGPMLLALIARDGGLGMHAPSQPTLPAAIAHAVSAADLVIMAGRSGSGADDDAAPALLAAGATLALHGIALQPGESTGLGLLRAVPVLLLPGEPLACLAAYEMVAARAVRRLSGLAEPTLAPVVPLSRKIVSTIGMVDLVFVRMQDAGAIPLAADGLAAMHADGYVVVPETSEGFAAGSLVPFHPYDAAGQTLPP